MSDTVTFARITGMETGPAVWLEGWVPDLDAFPELTEAREKTERLRAAWRAAGERRRDLEARAEADTEQRKTALRDAYLQGVSAPEADGDGEKLTAELAEAKEHAQAAAEAYLEHINAVIGLVIQHGREWQAKISTFQESVDGEVRALLAQAAQLRARRGHFARLSYWIERTVRGGEMPAEHFPYSEISAPPSGSQQEEDAQMQEFFERSYAGGVAPERKLSEEEGRALEAQVLSSQRQRPVADDVDYVEVELSDLDPDDLVEWLMSTGGFDGNPKPTAAQVIEAAEGDAAMAQRLMQAERRAGGDAVRQDVLDRLSQITSGKVGV